MALQIPRAVLDEVRAHGREAYPHECCGLLVGELAVPVRVRRSVRGRNLNASRPWDRYELDPADFLRANREADAQGQTVVGCYHTHPDHPALPSATDAALACPDFSYLILAVRNGEPAEARSWLFAEPAAARYVELRGSGDPAASAVVGYWHTEYVLFAPVCRGGEERAAVRETSSRVVTEESVEIV